MDIVKKLLGLYLVVVGIAVFLNLMLTPVYHDGSAEYPVWETLNYFMAAAVVIALIFSVHRKLRGSDSDGLQTNAAFYGAIALTMLYFWNWFWTLNPDSETSDPAVISHLLHWPMIDALLVTIAIGVGSRLLKGGAESQ